MFKLKLLYFFTFIASALLLNIGHLFSQNTLEKVDPKFFTLRNSKLTLGLSANGNRTDKENNTPIFQIAHNFDAEENYELQYSSDELPYISIGIYGDLFSPNSILGVSLGCEYNINTFSILYNQRSYGYSIQNILFPVYLDFKFGSISGKKTDSGRKNFFLSMGAFYSLPMKLNRTTSGVEQSLSGLLNQSLGLSTKLGYIHRLKKQSKESNYYVEYPRFQVFIRIDHFLNSLFNSEYSEFIVPNLTGKSVNYRTTNVTVGMAVFLGGKILK